MNIKAAIFDMDGTLVDSLMLLDVLWSEFGNRFLNGKNFTPSSEDDKKVRTLTLKDAMDLIHKNYNIGENGAELLKIANEIMTNFYKHKVELKKGVREFLDCLKERNVKMCIASATAPDLIELAIEHCGLGTYFSKIFSCAAINKGKDQPDIFLIARDYLGERNENTYVFEDSLVAIETADHIGLPTVGIYDKYNFGQEKIKEIANEYIAPDETLLKLIK